MQEGKKNQRKRERKLNTALKIPVILIHVLVVLFTCNLNNM